MSTTVLQGVGTTFNLPNFHGQLFTADPVRTPLLSMSGGMTGGMLTTNFEFPTALLFNYPEAEQPNISEDDSIIAPNPRHIVRRQLTNVVQIHHKTINLSYHGLGNRGRLSGLNTVNQSANPADEEAFQIQHSLLIPAARDIEHSFIVGAFNKTATSSVANRTRGMIQVCHEGGVVLDAAHTNRLSFEMLQELYRAMADNGAYFGNMFMFVGASLKQQVTAIYSKLPGATLPATRTQGGINITNILTDFCELQVVWNRFMPDNAVLLCDMNHVSPVFMATPGKGVFFVEELARVGASERHQLYGEVGLDHGPAFMHGCITNIQV